MATIINNKPTVIIDCDGIVYQCDEAILKDINEKHGTRYTIEDISVYGLTGDAILDTKFNYYRDKDFVLNQPLYPGAVEFVSELQKRAKVYFCTAVVAEGMTARAEALMRDFGVSQSQIIIASDKSLVTGDYFLDDSPYNIERSIATHPVLFRRPWNHDVSGVMSVSKYDDFLCFLDYMEHKVPFAGIKEDSIVCLVGPSGAGKTEMLESVISSTDYRKIATYTTANKDNYYCLSEDEFVVKRNEGFFAETTVYGGNKYGISRETVDCIMDSHRRYICAIDICGAMALKNIFKDRVAIIYVSASKEELYINLLRKDLPEKEKILRFMSIDAEITNKQFCDLTVKSTKQLLEIL